MGENIFKGFSQASCTYLLVACSGTLALTCDYQDGLKQVFSSSRDIMKVAEFGGSGRKTAEEYAKIHGQQPAEVQRRYGASGELKCGTLTSSGAELVLTHSTVLIALHGLFKDGSCSPIAPLDQCQIRFQTNGTNQYFKIAGIRSSGAPCPHPGNASIKEDWMILNLKTPASDFKPYKVRNPAENSSKQVVGVGQSVDFYQSTGAKRYYPMHYSDCHINDVYANGMLGTNCGTSGSSSGSGIFDEDLSDPHLEGINIGSNENADIIKDELIHHRVENRPYDSKTWSSVYLPIAGSLQQALLSLNSSESIRPKDSTPPSSGEEDI